MRIRRKFLQLTKWTYPNGTEAGLKNLLPNGYKEDGLGNYYYSIGDNPTTMFTCHLDTCCVYKQKVNHIFDGNFIRTNGKTILGADDKAGMVVVLSMIENKIPGLYYFFIGEEVGCIGSGLLADHWGGVGFEFTNDITKIVSFDRRGTTSVITHQLYGRCCSDSFAKELSSRLNGTEVGINLSPDDTGIMTDSAQFIELVPECTNISVGYYNEHMLTECQDIDFLCKLCKAVCQIDWETLPVERDPDIDEDDYYTTYYGGSNYPRHPLESEWMADNYTYVNVDGGTKKMYVSKTQIDKEKSIIYKWVFSQGYPDITGISWNGNNLYAETTTKFEFLGSRFDLSGMIPELRFIPISQLSDTYLKEVKKEISTKIFPL